MAGILVRSTGTTPATPTSGQVSEWADSADLNRVKAIDSNGVVSIASQVRKHNILTNGGFDFAQRQAPAVATTYSALAGRAITADRWGVTNENASVQYLRTDTSAGPVTGLVARYYGRFTKITNTGKFVLSQVIEGNDTMPLRGQTVRFQVRMRYAPLNPMTVRLGLAYLTSAGTIDTMPATFISAFGAVGTDPTLGTNLTYITPSNAESTGTISGSGVTCVLTNTFARYSATFAIPASALNVIPLIWTNGQPIATDSLDLAEAGLYLGTEICDWAPEAIGQGLARCQRYYAKTFNVDTAPAQNVGVNTGEFKWTAGFAAAVAGTSPSFLFKTTMRTAPTVTTYNPAAANAQVRDETAAADCSAAATAGIADGSLGVTYTGNGATAVGNLLGVHLTADAEI